MRILAALVMTFAVGCAGAQAHDRKPRRDKAPERRANACAAYGPGFVMLEGTSTCVRVGGMAAGQMSVGSGAENLGVK